MSEEEQKPLQLEYMQPQKVRWATLDFILGCGGGAGLICVLGFMGGFLAMAIAPVGGVVVVVALAAAISFVIYWAVRHRRDPNRQALAAGLWTGLALGVLVTGGCYALLLR